MVIIFTIYYSIHILNFSVNRGREQEASGSGGTRLTHTACGAAVVVFIFRRVAVFLVAASLLAVSDDVSKS